MRYFYTHRRTQEDTINILPFDTPTFRIAIPLPHVAVIVKTPSKADYYRMVASTDKKGMTEYMLRKYGDRWDIPFTEVMATAFISSFVKDLDDYRSLNMDVMKIPEQIDFMSVDREIKMPCLTSGERLVYEHSGLDFIQQNELPVTEYWILLADAIKMRIMQRSDSDEYLEQCYQDMHRINTLTPNVTE